MSVTWDEANLRACQPPGGRFPRPGIESGAAQAATSRPPGCTFPVLMTCSRPCRGHEDAGRGPPGPPAAGRVPSPPAAVRAASRLSWRSRSASRRCPARRARSRSAAASCSGRLQPGLVLPVQRLPLPGRVIAGLPGLITGVGFSLPGPGQLGLGSTNRRRGLLTGLIAFRPCRLSDPGGFGGPPARAARAASASARARATSSASSRRAWAVSSRARRAPASAASRPR